MLTAPATMIASTKAALRSQSAMVVYPPRMPWRTSRITGARTARAYPASAALKLPLACSAWAGSPPAVMYRRPPTTRNRVATAARIPMIHTLRPSMTSGMVFAARTSGAGAAAIRSPAAETMVYAYMSGLHEGRWAAFGGEPRDVLAGGGAPPYVVCEGWWSVRPYRVPASRPRGAHPHRGGHAISGMHPPRPTLSGQTNSPPTCPDLTAPNDAGHSPHAMPCQDQAGTPVDRCQRRCAYRSGTAPRRLADPQKTLSAWATSTRRTPRPTRAPVRHGCWPNRDEIEVMAGRCLTERKRPTKSSNAS